MKKMNLAACVLAFLGAATTSSMSAQFDDSEVLPSIRYLVFSPEAVGFVSHENRLFADRRKQSPTGSGESSKGSSGATFYFIYDRRARQIAEANAGQFAKRFPGSPPRDDPFQDPSKRYDLIGHATGGVEYKLKMKYCGEGVTDEIREVVVNNKAVNVLSREECTSVSRVEIVNDQLWLGTAYSGEAGISGAEGIIVEDRAGKAVLARLDTKGAVIQVKADPFSHGVWVVTDVGIYEISPQFKILSTNFYSHDIEPSTSEPRFSFSSKIVNGNPLLAISRLLPKADRKKFYQAVTAIPQGDLKKFGLYNFFMGCLPAYDEVKEETPNEWPKSFQPLFPFFMKANEQCAQLARTK